MQRVYRGDLIARDNSKSSAFVPQEHPITMRSDDRDRKTVSIDPAQQSKWRPTAVFRTARQAYLLG